MSSKTNKDEKSWGNIVDDLFFDSFVFSSFTLKNSLMERYPPGTNCYVSIVINSQVNI